MGAVVHWLENHMLPCPYKHYLGIDCPGCGMQRACIDLLNGEVVASFLAYPPLIPTIVMILYLIAHLIFKFRNGAVILKYLFIFVTVTVAVNYILKLILKH